MPVFKAQKIPRKIQTSDDVLSIFCYHFPQYKYEEAKKLPYKRVAIMLRTARKERAKYMTDLLRVMTGSRSKKGTDNVLSYFKDIIEG